MIPTCKKIYLCDFNLRPLTVLNGVDTSSVEYSCHVKDYDELTFDVDEYIVINCKKVKSLGYDLLLPYMTVYLEDLGMFQIQNPKTSNDGNSEKKSITAYSLEKEFEDKNWLNFKCNTGDKDSLEQVAENNLNELGYAKEFVTFYNKNKHDLSFIHLLLEKLPGWSADDDDIDPVLWTRKLPAITQDNTNLYALCCSYIAPRMEILFLFDTIHRKIKAIAKENLNDKKYESTVFISYRNLAQSIDINVDEDSIFTRFNVRGDNDLNVINCNYGDYYIMNLDYFLCSPYISDELLIKVKKWIKYRDDNRDKYIEIAKNVADASKKVNDIIYRNPADDLNIKQWDDMNEDGLNESLKYYNSLLTSLQVSVDPNWDASNNDFSTYKPWTKADGSVDHDKYLEKLKAQENGYGGYYTYYDILHYIIPNIEIAIRNLKKVDEKKEDYIKDWETNWDLYGTSELDALNKKYTEELEKVQDYAKPWNELTDEEKRANSGNEDSYNIYHNKYVEIYGYISANGTLTAAIAKRNQEKDSAQKILDEYSSQMSDMKKSASINNKDYGFTDEDKTVIYSLFHDQDYQNSNILKTSVDTSVTEIDREKELYDDAVEKLSEVAQPQFKFTVSLDNLYRIEAFKHWQGELELLKFIRLGIRDDYSVKLRVTGITWNPCDVTEDLTLEFSNMITSRSGRTDLTELLDTENNRGSKNSISFGTGNSDSEKEYFASMLQQLIKMGAFKTAVGNIAENTTTNLNEAKINTLVSNFINTSKIKVGNIDGDKGSFNEFFTKYLDSEVISTNIINGQNGDLIDFINSQLKIGTIDSDVANIKTILSGSIGTGDLRSITITSNNATFSEAVIKELIAAKISVADLMTHAATAELITLISKDGKPSIAFKDSTQQFYDNNGNIRVQIGQDATGNFTFSLFDETGQGVLIDSKDGVHQGAIKDGLIVNNMLKDDSISKDKLNFPIVETDENGKISITEILDGSGNSFGISYKEFQDNTSNALSGIEDKVDKVNKSITSKIWESDIEDKINNYDQTTISDLSKRVSESSQDIKGFKQTVSEIYAKNDDIKTINTSFEQLSNKFEWLVTKDSSQSSLTITDSLISAITKQFIIKDNDSTTIIEGGKIKTNVITSDMLSSSAIKSNNYKEGEYKTFSSAGSFLDLDTGAFHMPNLYVDNDGNAFFNGNITATSGKIGDCSISDGKLIIPTVNISGTLTAEQISVDSLSSLSSNLGDITGGSINIKDAFIVDSDGNVTATSSQITGQINATEIRAKKSYSIYSNVFETYQKIIDWDGETLKIGIIGDYDEVNGYSGSFINFIGSQIITNGIDSILCDNTAIQVKNINCNRIDAAAIYTNDGKTSIGVNLVTQGTLSVYGKTGLHSDAYVSGNFTFKDYYEQEKLESDSSYNTKLRRPISSASTGINRIAYIKSDDVSGKKIISVYGRFGADMSTDYSQVNFTASSSDIRLKTNIKDSNVNAIKALMKIKIREFDWKLKNNHQSIGFVADELEKVDPMFTVGGGYNPDGSINVKTVDTFYLLGYLVKGFQEQQNEINKLKTIIYS